MNKEELEDFYKNANQEELLAHEIDLLSFGDINSAMLATCEVYGLSGNCGSKCPKFKDKSCEVYDEVLEKENTNLKQALIDIRGVLKEHKYDLDYEPWSIYKIKGKTLFDILQIIDKVLGGEKAMQKYKVRLQVEGSLEIDEPIEAESYDEAVNIAIKEYGNEAWYSFCGNAELIEEEEDLGGNN